MIKVLNSVHEYRNFINEIGKDEFFGDPGCKNEEKLQSMISNALKDPSKQVIGVFRENIMIGFFIFLIIKEDQYIELLLGLSKEKQAYDEMIQFLKQNYPGYQADFVYNPKNYLLQETLTSLQAEFAKEQQRMVLDHIVPYQSNHQIVLYEPKYREQYCAIHLNDCYWTAERVIEAPDDFRIILAIQDDQVVGYIDITYQLEDNEPFDVFVKKEYRRQGIAKAMLAKAIELNQPKKMSLLVNVDNYPAIALYESLGFITVKDENSILGTIQC